MLPCGICATLLSNHMIFCLPSKSMCHVIWKPTMHSHPKIFQPHPTAHVLGPCIHCGKFVVALQPQFPFFYTSLLALLQISDRHASFLHHSCLDFLLFLLFFNSFLFLTGFHHFLLLCCCCVVVCFIIVVVVAAVVLVV